MDVKERIVQLERMTAQLESQLVELREVTQHDKRALDLRIAHLERVQATRGSWWAWLFGHSK